MIRIDSQLTDFLSCEAKNSPRLRKNYNFHKQDDDLLQRMLNALEPDTYVQPHRHHKKREVFIVLKGKIIVAEFNDEGKITEHILLDHSVGNYGAEISASTWHTVISLESGSVYYEVKDGPYDAATDKEFATWAPAENSGKEKEYLRELKKLLNVFLG